MVASLSFRSVPLLYLLLLWILGRLAPAGVVIAGAVLLILLGAVARIRPGTLVTLHRLSRTAFAFALVLLVSLLARVLHQRAPSPDVADFVSACTPSCRIAVTATERGRAAGSSLYFAAQHARIVAADSSFVVRGRIQVRIRDAASHRVEAGDRLHLVAQLLPLPPRRNPADFDYGAFLAREGIRAVAEVATPRAVLLTARATPPLPERIRDRLRVMIAQLYPLVEEEALVRALVLGDRSLLSDEQEDPMARSGLLHLLAISGLHVALIGMSWYAASGPLLRRLLRSWHAVEWIRAASTIGLVTAYVGLAGWPPSGVRALVMGAWVLAATLLQRPSASWNALAGAALVVLLLRPQELASAGFHLSFGAVAGILAFATPWRRWIDSVSRSAWGRYLGNSIGVSIGATIGTAPALLYHFGYLPLAGILLNVIAIPAGSLLLASILLSLVAGVAAAGPAEAFVSVSIACMSALAHLASFGADALQFLTVSRYVREPLVVAAFTAACIAAAFAFQPRLRWRGLIVALFLLAAHQALRVSDAPHTLDLVFLDVGHGDATVVHLPGGPVLLVDTGAPGSGERTILPHLQRYARGRADAVVLTHPDGDHTGGLPYLIEEAAVGRVFVNGQRDSSALSLTIEQQLAASRRRATVLRRGMRLKLDPSVAIDVLSPGRPIPDDDNDASVVLRIQYGDHCFLLTGDAERGSEEKLVELLGDRLRCDVVKVGHHGSRTSSTEAFVDAAGEESRWALVSVGRASRYGLPDEEVVRRWQVAADSLHVTARSGALWLRSDGRSLWPVPWRTQ